MPLPPAGPDDGPGRPGGDRGRGVVARLTWSRPERRNAIGIEICQALTAAVGELSARSDIAVIVMDSALPPFCAGFDLQDLAGLQGASHDDLARFFTYGRGLVDALEAAPQVLVCAPRGYALGFGTALLAHADVVLSEPDTFFGLPEIGAGIVASTVLPDLLTVMDRRTVQRWALDGLRRTATEAHAAGLVTELVAPGALADVTGQLVDRLAGYPPGLLRRAKATAGRIAAAAPTERVATAVAAAMGHLESGRLESGRSRDLPNGDGAR